MFAQSSVTTRPGAPVQPRTAAPAPDPANDRLPGEPDPQAPTGGRRTAGILGELPPLGDAVQASGGDRRRTSNLGRLFGTRRDPLQTQVDALLDSPQNRLQIDRIAALMRKLDGCAQHEPVAFALARHYRQITAEESITDDCRERLLPLLIQTLLDRGIIEPAQATLAWAAAARLGEGLRLCSTAHGRDPAGAAVLPWSRNLIIASLDSDCLARRLRDSRQWEELVKMNHRMGRMTSNGFLQVLQQLRQTTEQMRASGFLSTERAAQLRARLPDLVEHCRQANRRHYGVSPDYDPLPATAHGPAAAGGQTTTGSGSSRMPNRS